MFYDCLLGVGSGFWFVKWSGCGKVEFKSGIKKGGCFFGRCLLLGR